MFRKSYTDEDIINYTAKVTSIAGLLRLLGLKPIGGNYGTVKRKLQKLNVDASHWKGQGWNKNEQLKDWANYKGSDAVKRNLIKERGLKCESCDLSIWKGKPIPIELHHIDGNRTNNQLKNLQLLCPNCHSQTDNWKNRK